MADEHGLAIAIQGPVQGERVGDQRADAGLKGLGYRLVDGGRVGVARLAFVLGPDGNNVEALGHR